MSPTPQDSGVDQPIFWTGIVALGAVVIAWAKRLSPLSLVQGAATMVFNPVMEKHIGPVNRKLDKVCRVIDHLPGAQAAHQAVRLEDQNHDQWEDK